MNCCYLYTDNSRKIKERDGFYENLLYKSIETLLMFYKNDIKYIYILIDNKIDNEKLINIQKNISKINNTHINIIYKLIDLNITNIIKYPNNNINSLKINNIGLLKFFIPYLVDCDDILYIDCDILFNKNVLNDLYINFNNDNILYKIYQEGFNSGLILFNCINYRKNKTLLTDIINYYKNKNDIKYVDNETFAWLAHDSKYKDLIIIDENNKINYPICDDNGVDAGVWKSMNIIHLAGWYEFKEMYIDEIYNYIKQNNN